MIKTLIYLNRYTFYALLKDAFGKRVRMLYTDTDSFFLHFFVKDLAKEINSRPHLRNTFDFSEIGNGHLSNLGRGIANLHAGEVGYFKDETKGNPIVEFFGLRPKMYSFNVCDASEPIPGVNYPIDVRHKAVAKGVARSQIKRFKHEDYVRMYKGGALTNVVKCRIGSKLHQVRLIISILIFMTAHLSICFQVYTMEQEKRGLCPYDDKRYLLADLPDGRPNPNTHAYGHRDLAAEAHLVADQPEPGAELIIRHPEERFARRHARVSKRLELAGAMELEEELPDGDADGELHGDQLVMAERVVAARPGGAIRMGDVIERVIGRDNLEQPSSSPARTPTPITPQRAGPSGLNAHMPPFRRRVESFDEDEPDRPVWPPRRPHLEFKGGDYEQEDDTEPQPVRRRKNARRRANPFIDTEAGVDGNGSGDKRTDDENDDLNGFIVADDIEY